MDQSTENIQYFHALAAFYCRKNRLYRIYITDTELLFIWAGKGTEGLLGAQTVGAMGGIENVIGGGGLHAALDPSDVNAARTEVLNSEPLTKLISDDERNMRVLITDITTVRIASYSQRHANTFSDHQHQALMFLRHRQFGKFRLGIASIEDVKVALRCLPPLLGEKCSVEIEWSESAKKYIAFGQEGRIPVLEVGPNWSTILHTCIVGGVLGMVMFILFLIVGLSYGTLNSAGKLLQAVGLAALIGSAIPAAVFLCSITRLRIIDGTVEYLLFWGLIIVRRKFADLMRVKLRQWPFAMVMEFQGNRRLRLLGLTMPQMDELLKYIQEWSPKCQIIK